LLGGKAGSATLRHGLGQFMHRLPRDRASLATGERGFRLINGSKNFRAAPFPLLPQSKSFFYRVFLASKPSARNRLPDKGLLVRGELDFHIPLA